MLCNHLTDMTHMKTANFNSPAGHYARMVYAMDWCVRAAVCLSQAGVLTKWTNRSSWFLAQTTIGLSHPTLCWKGASVSPKLKACPHRRLLQSRTGVDGVQLCSTRLHGQLCDCYNVAPRDFVASAAMDGVLQSHMRLCSMLWCGQSISILPSGTVSQTLDVASLSHLASTFVHNTMVLFNAFFSRITSYSTRYPRTHLVM